MRREPLENALLMSSDSRKHVEDIDQEAKQGLSGAIVDPFA